MHSIHLRHPWQSEARDSSTVWTRRFNWPAEPDAGERILLVIEAVPDGATATLNAIKLGCVAQAPFDVTRMVAVHNRLVLVVPCDGQEAAERFPYEVRLDIVAADAAAE